MSRTFPSNSAERVYAALRHEIVSGQREPGCILSRAKLADAHDVSQTPVREALLRLEREGMVEVRAQSKTSVSQISMLSVHQAMFLRRALEIEAVRRLAAVPEKRDLSNIEAAVAGEDRLFHRALFRALGMEEVFEGVSSMLVPLERCRAIADLDPKQAVAEHSDILGRIRAGDLEGAGLAMQAHLASEMHAFGALREQRPAFFA